MIQKMMNRVLLDVPDVDLTAVYNIEVTFDQKASGVELTYSDEAIFVADESHLSVDIPKEDAMKLVHKPIRYQVMFMNTEEVPGASKIYIMPVDELLKDDGYGE